MTSPHLSSSQELSSHERAGAAMRGANQLAFDAVSEVTRIVEGMHASIAGTPRWLGSRSDERAPGIAGLVYAGIRGVTELVESSTERALSLLDTALLSRAPLPQPHWDAAVAILNGVLGDRLVDQGNPLAIPMRLRHGGVPLEPGWSPPTPKLLVLVHGLCMSDGSWLRNGHDHGARLGRELGYTPVYAFYNSGRHVSQNGRLLARHLEYLISGSPTPIDEITILGHSLGGLVTRSAAELGRLHGHAWRRGLRRMLFLGAPHLGAPLEQVGNQLQSLVRLSPYVAPLGRLGMLRSGGITDLRHGSLLEADWRNRDRFEHFEPAHVPLPTDVASFAIAGTLATRRSTHDLIGDGLVPPASALGQHADPDRGLAFPPDHRWLARATGHMELLQSPEVYATLRRWLARPVSA